MMIDTRALIACGVGPGQAKAFAPFIDDACRRFGMVSIEQRAAFIAQAMHESSDFTQLEENLYYSTPERIRQIFPSRVASLAEAAALAKRPEALANVVYAGKNGNGNTASGEGWRFKGRGLFQLTGLTNYLLASDALGRDYKAHPEMVAFPEDAALTAGWYWQAHGCNELMSGGDFDAVSLRINGPAMAGARERRALYAACLDALRGSP